MEPRKEQQDVDQKTLAAKNRKVFTLGSEICGLPAKAFVLGLVLCVPTALTISFWSGLLLALLYFPVQYHIHREDPNAFFLWLSFFVSPRLRWSAHQAERRQFLIFTRDGTAYSLADFKNRPSDLF